VKPYADKNSVSFAVFNQTEDTMFYELASFVGALDNGLVILLLDLSSHYDALLFNPPFEQEARDTLEEYLGDSDDFSESSDIYTATLSDTSDNECSDEESDKAELISLTQNFHENLQDEGQMQVKLSFRYYFL
jgi:hypothetical protein